LIFFPNCFGILSIVFDGFGGDDSNPRIVPFLPRRATVHLNGYREADTFEVEFDAKLFPFSPELLRSAAVELFMFQTDGLLVNALEAHKSNGQEVWNLSQFTTPDETGNNPNRVIAGLVDSADLHYGEDGRSFKVQGRDYTALLVGRDWPDGKRIPIGEDLAQTVQDLVDEAVGASVRNAPSGQITKTGKSTLFVRYIGSDQVETTANGQGATKRKEQVFKPPPKVGAHHSKTQKKGFPVHSGKNYWDVIYDLCVRHGKIAFVSGNTVVISDPHTLTQISADNALKVAYGRNLQNLEISRHMGKEAVPQIVAYTYDKATRKQIAVKWPDKPFPALKQTSQKGHGAAEITGIGTVKEQTLRIIPPQSITDPATLQAYCKAYYDNLARSEASIKFTTKFLKDLNSSNMLAVRPGDPVRVQFDPFRVEDMRNLDEFQRYNRMLELGYSDEVAELVATEFDKLNRFQAPYYVKDVSFSWDKDSGISIDVEALNYIAPTRSDGPG
jgi:hypothetical protein